MGAGSSSSGRSSGATTAPKYASIGLVRPIVVEKPMYNDPITLNGHEIWKRNVQVYYRDTDESYFKHRIKSQALDLDTRVDQNDAAIHQIRLKRIATEQTNSYPNESSLSNQSVIPNSHINSIFNRLQSATTWSSKYFSIKPKRIELTKLHLEHIRRVTQVQPSNELLIELDGVQILRKDIQTLLGLNWLNDEIINAYMYLLVCRGKQNNNKKVHAFNTFFYPKLRDSGYSSIKRWTRKVDIFSHDLVLVPIHLGNHWCLAVIDFNNKRISYYDSLGGSAGVCCKLLLNYLKDEMNDKKKQCFDMENWTLAEFRGGSKDVPRQENGSDCGVFTCIYAEHITRKAKFEFSQKDMPYFRQKMIYEITKGQLLQ